MRNVKRLLIVLLMLSGGIASSLSPESIQYLNNAPNEVVEMMRNALIAKQEASIYKKSYTDVLELVNKQIALTTKIEGELQKSQQETKLLLYGITAVSAVAIGEFFFILLRR